MHEASEPTPREVLFRAVLRIWTAFGGDLRVWWDDVQGAVRGDVVAFFLALVRPILGKSSPAITTVPRIVRREAARREREKTAERRPAEWIEGGIRFDTAR